MKKEIKQINPYLQSWHRDSPIYEDLIEKENKMEVQNNEKK